MRGCWLSKSKAALATGLTPHDFQKTYATKLKERKEGKWPEYFLPEDNMTDTSKAALADCMEELPSDDVADIVEGILGDISQGSLEGARGIPLDLDSQLQAAQLEKIKVQTKALGEKLTRQRQEIWNSWNEEFFPCFAEAFAKVKNRLIELHLDEEQLKILKDSIDLALGSMKTKLDFMYNDWMENGLEKEDNLEDDLLK